MLPAISGYDIGEEIYEGSKTIVYKGNRRHDNTSVMIKLLKSEHPSLKDMVQLYHELEITKDLSLNGVVKPYVVEKCDNRYILVLEDFGGESLKKSCKDCKNDDKDRISCFLKRAIRISEILGEIHRNRIVHKDIKPHNIIINCAKGEIKITDFGISSFLKENQEAINPNFLEGTLAYMSPEQTGRMNLSVDYRTDIYSLGVTFYEMLTGKLPFDTTNAIDLVYSHIAKNPISLRNVNENIPAVISDIVMKCLSKSPIDRYQNAFSIKKDLKTCLEQYKNTKQIVDFRIADKDMAETLQIPQKLYGREKEIEILINAFERVSMGQSELLLVSGYSGIGKSSLVNEIHKPIVSKRGYFIKGKYDQYKRNVPYSSLIQAFSDLIRQILTESEEYINNIKVKILSVLEKSASVIVEVIPELELIIGKQDTVSVLPPLETQNRFNLLFQRFIKVFMTEDHPLVLFLDDLQWVDSASLNLIKILLTNHESKYLFMIGAYRNNEVDGNHPLTEALNEVRRFTFHVDKKMPINEILIEPLNLSHTKLWLSDTFNTSYIEELSVLVSDKTHGNPFFIKEFIKSLYDNKLIKLNTEKGIWEWDIKELKKRDFTDNVIDHMCNRIKNLSYETQKALSIASCIGTFFDLNDLSLIYDKTQKETINILREALFNELIIPIGDEYKYILSTDEVTDFKVSFKFVHDRVQQSVYSLVADTEKDKLHLKIGKLLLENTSSDDLEEKLLEIVDHLNISSHLISSKEEKIELSKLNLRAGQKAKISAAFNSALDYITKGMNLLSEDSWDNEYDLTYQLYIEKGELLYINAKYEDAEDNLNIALSKANTNMEKAKVYNLLMTICNSLSRYRDTISFGEKGFRLFGFTIPKTEKDLIREGIKEYEILKKRMAKKNIIDVFKNMSVPADINQTVILNFTLNFALSAFQIVKNDYLYTYIATKMMNFMLDNNIVSGSCLFMFALDLVRTHNNYDLANKLCELALEIEEKYNSPNIDAKLITYFAVYIQHWKKPFFESISTFNRAFQIAKEQRDKLALLYTVHHYPKHKYIKGMELNIVLDDIKKVIPYIQETYNIVLIILCRLFESTILNLKGLTKSQISFDNDSFTEEDYIKISKDPKYPFLYSRYCLAKSFTLFLFDHVEEAYNFAVECDKEILLYSAKGQAHIPEFYFTYSLILSNLYPSRKLNDKKKYMKTLSKLLAQMKEWGDNCPENYGHKYLLMSAEMMRIRGKDTSAMRLYKMAIKQAKDNMFLQDTAIANELAAKFYLYKGFEEIFSIYITESHYYYSLWGASAKVNDIELKYGDLLIKPSTKVNIDPTTTSTLSIAKTIDIKTVMNASQAISREIVLDNLLKRLMDIVITTSGASNGYFIMDIDNDLVVKAYRDVKNDGNANLDSIPVSNLTKFTQSLILYAKRTKEHIVINDVSNDDTFSKKLDKISDKAKSAMAIPILSKDKIIGILYLENHLTTGAFLDNKLELLKMLSSQIAISLENAMFYESLQKSQKEITRLNTKIHNSIMNKLKTIQGRIKLFEAKQANILDQQGFYDLNIINSLSSHASKECNNILFILGNHDCTIKSLIKEITFRADLSLVPYNIKYTMNCDSSLESVILPSESIQYLLDGYDEAINNILKHSKARNVDIGISNFTDGEINLSIKDDGIGFYIMNESSKQNSYGLKLMHQYSKQMNAKFDITADKGKGTLFSISIKIN